MVEKPVETEGDQKENVPTPVSSTIICRVRMEALRSRGRSRITDGDGGSEASAIAPNVSIIRLTPQHLRHREGDSEPKKEPKSTRKHAATFTVS